MNRLGLSIIIPIYNAEDYINECLESIISQNNNYNLEIILINDGSSDNSVCICNEYVERYNYIRLYNFENHGVSFARNRGLSYVTKEYIWFIDADDKVPTDFIKLLFKANLSQFDVICFPYLKETNNGKIQECAVGDCRSSNDCLKSIFNINFDAGVWRFIFKSKAINHVLFDEKLYYSEDILFLVQIFSKKLNCYSLCDFGYIYFYNDNSAVNSSFNDKRLSSIIAINQMETFINQYCPYVINDFLKYKANYYFYLSIGMLESNDIKYIKLANDQIDWLKKNGSYFWIDGRNLRESLKYYLLISKFNKIYTIRGRNAK